MDLKRTELGLLATLDVLLEARGVTAAARKLGMSQPAVSAQLAALRRVFDDPLLVGNAHGMVLTPLASAIQEELRFHIDGLNQLVHKTKDFDPATTERTFTIATTDYTQTVVLVPFLNHMSASAPGLRFALRAATGGLTRTLLEDTDLAVVSEAMTDPDMPARRLFSEEFRFVWRPGHPRINDNAGIDAFCDEAHVLVSPVGGGFEGIVDELLRGQDRRRRVAVSVPSFLSAIDLVAASDLCAVLPRRLVSGAKAHVLSAPPPIDVPPFTVVESWHPRQSNDRGHQWLRGALAEFCRRHVR